MNTRRLLNCAPPRKMLPEGGKRDLKCKLSPDAFVKDLSDRANAPFKFKPLGYYRHFGINE
jgi:hypothetical protein